MRTSLRTKSITIGTATVLLAGAAAVAASNGTAILPMASGDEVRDLAPFHSIEAAGAYDIDLKIGEQQSVTVSGKKLDELTTRVEDGVLIIELEEKDRSWFSFGGGTDYKVQIVATRFTGMELAGAMDASFKGLSGEDLTFSIAGASDVDMEGSCGKLSVSLAGASDFSAKNLECESVSIAIAGAGDASVFASQSIKASVAGISEVTVYGKPKDVDLDESGLGSITIR